jgi:hypothetical protein
VCYVGSTEAGRSVAIRLHQKSALKLAWIPHFSGMTILAMAPTEKPGYDPGFRVSALSRD